MTEILLLRNLLEELITEKKIVKKREKYFLTTNYEIENDIASYLKQIADNPIKKINKLDEYIKDIESELNIKYNNEQKLAITNALNNRISIISGGPGTGKTTIINAIVRIYVAINKLNPIDVRKAFIYLNSLRFIFLFIVSFIG